MNTSAGAINVATTPGVAISFLIIDHVRIRNGYIGFNQGHIGMADGDGLYIMDSEFVNTTESDNSGAVVFTGVRSLITRTKFVNNTVTAAKARRELVVFRDCRFTTGLETTRAVIIGIANVDLEFVRCVFRNIVVDGSSYVLKLNVVNTLVVQDCDFNGIRAADPSHTVVGIYSISSSLASADITDSKFRNFDRSIIKLDQSPTVTVTNCTFADNTNGGTDVSRALGSVGTGSWFISDSRFFGGFGGLFLKATAVTVDNCVFRGNKDRGAGAMRFTSVSALVIRDSVVTGNVGVADASKVSCNNGGTNYHFVGGGVFSCDSNLFITNTTLTDNTVENYEDNVTLPVFHPHGSAVSVIGGSAVVSTVTVKDNPRVEYTNIHGGIVLRDTTATVTGSTFSDCTSRDVGTGIFAHTTTAEVTDSVFRNGASNGTTEGTGALTAVEANVTVTNSVFTNNSFAAVAGAFVTDGSHVTLNGVTFNDSSSDTHSAGVSCDDASTLTVTLCEFAGLSSRGESGALNCEGLSSCTVTDSEFTGNTAELCGGAIRAHQSELSVTGSTFTNNDAYNGGAVCSKRSYSDFTDNTFANNSATQYGGALRHTGADGGDTIANCVFEHNYAGHRGGAVSTLTHAVNVSECQFTHNSALGIGAVQAHSQAVLYMVDSTVADNTGTGGGGAVGGKNADFVLVNSTFTDNVIGAETGSSLFFGVDCTAKLLSLVVSGSSGPPSSGVVFTGEGSGAYFSGCSVVDNIGAAIECNGSTILIEPDNEFCRNSAPLSLVCSDCNVTGLATSSYNSSSYGWLVGGGSSCAALSVESGGNTTQCEVVEDFGEYNPGGGGTTTSGASTTSATMVNSTAWTNGTTTTTAPSTTSGGSGGGNASVTATTGTSSGVTATSGNATVTATTTTSASGSAGTTPPTTAPPSSDSTSTSPVLTTLSTREIETTTPAAAVTGPGLSQAATISIATVGAFVVIVTLVVCGICTRRRKRNVIVVTKKRRRRVGPASETYGSEQYGSEAGSGVPLYERESGSVGGGFEGEDDYLDDGYLDDGEFVAEDVGDGDRAGGDDVPF